MDLSQLKFENLNLVFVFTTPVDSKLASRLTEQSANYAPQLENNKAKILLVSQTQQTEGFITDTQDVLRKKVKELGKDYGQNLIIFEVKNGELNFVEIKKAPNPNTSWYQALKQYVENFSQSQPDGVYYKWGQIVPDDGEYYCKDCGFVINLSKGQLFPICESCLSGEPDGISGPDQGYWEKIS